MRVALLCNDDLTTNIIFAPVFAVEGIEVTGVFFAGGPSRKHSTVIGGALALFRKMSPRYWCYLVATNGVYKLFEKMTLWFGLSPRSGALASLRRLAQMQQIPYVTIRDFAAPEFLARLKTMSIDLLLIRVGAILTQEVLAIPVKGTWCVHSSLLPSFKGIAGEFHALRFADAPIGSTVFRVTPKLDEGPPIAQVTIARDDRRSVFDHMLRNNHAAADLLASMLRHAQSDSIPDYPLPGSGLIGSYFSWPQPEHMAQARGHGIRLIAIGEWLRLCAGALRLTRQQIH